MGTSFSVPKLQKSTITPQQHIPQTLSAPMAPSRPHVSVELVNTFVLYCCRQGSLKKLIDVGKCLIIWHMVFMD